MDGSARFTHLRTHRRRRDDRVQARLISHQGGCHRVISAFSGKTSKLDKLKFAFKIYDIDRDGYIGNGELFIVMKMMVGKNLQDEELQQIVDKTMMEADEDADGRLNFHEFKNAVDSKSVASALTLNMV